MNRTIAVTMECFIKKDGKYLMLHRAPNKRIMPGIWMATGGHVEFNEGLYEATRREVREETGLTINNLQVKAVGTAYIEDLEEEFFFHLLVADYVTGEVKSNSHDGEFRWLTPAEILQLPTLLAELKYVLPSVFDGTDKIVSYRARYLTCDTLTDFQLETP